ncbi:MAG TPA: hypothetical protein DCS93_05435 [Microscillaceae bacterium]|nr:hypothetical protein [Microscillaceae bacterium]
MQESLSKTNDLEEKQIEIQMAQQLIEEQDDQLLLTDLEMDIAKLDLAPDFAEQLEAFPLLKRMWAQIRQQIEETSEEGE